MKKEKRPALVSFIADLNFLNVFLLIVSLFPIPNFAERFGIYFNPAPTFSEGVIRLLVAIILLIIAYGLLRLKSWGFWLMIAYNCFFLVISMIFLLKLTNQSFYNPGYIASIIGLTLTLPAKRYFVKQSEPA